VIMQMTIEEVLGTDIEKTFFQSGAMYAKVLDDELERSSIELGDGILRPSEFVARLGEKDRTSFIMQEGNYLRYCGRYGRLILFSVNDFVSDYYYAFIYIDKNTLLLCSNEGCKDIRIQKLEKAKEFAKRIRKCRDQMKEGEKLVARNLH
jgi:hypothetical protein